MDKESKQDYYIRLCATDPKKVAAKVVKVDSMLADSIAREQEIKRELEYLQRELWAARESSKLAFRDAAKFAEQVHQERAHADALAAELEGVCEDWGWQQSAINVLEAYRKSQDPGE